MRTFKELDHAVAQAKVRVDTTYSVKKMAEERYADAVVALANLKLELKRAKDVETAKARWNKGGGVHTAHSCEGCGGTDDCMIGKFPGWREAYYGAAVNK